MFKTRQAALKLLNAMPKSNAPILIVGGGINGIGLYRDLALQGIPAIMVDKGDFASGTSAASSRLIHGGLRYLETGEIALVKESVEERNALLANASHLVRPLAVLVPAQSYFGGLFSAGLRFLKIKKTPGPKGIIAVKLGLTFFDRFGRSNRSTPTHRILSAKTGRKKIPGLSKSVRAVAQYYDTRIVCPERLALEIIADAEQDCPDSIALNYMEVQHSDGNCVSLKDGISGEEFQISPCLVINCGGVWVDRVNSNLGIETHLMGGTRGSHLILDRPDLAAQLADSMLYFETEDFRACLIYAIDNRHILMGTTDIRADDPDNVVCSQDEIDYIFAVTRQILPDANFKQEDISFTYSGIRPLPASNDDATGSISRDHSFHMYPSKNASGFDTLVLVGGKWTTYRACAEQLSGRVLGILGKKRLRSTLNVAIGGGKAFSKTERATLKQNLSGMGLDQGLPEILIERYGSLADEVALAIVNTSGDRVANTPYYVGEIRWIVESGRVARLADVIMRRTRLPFEGAVTEQSLRAICEICADCLSWDTARQEQEILNVKDILKSRHLTTVT